MRQKLLLADALVLATALAVTSGWGGPAGKPAFAASFTVNSTGDGDDTNTLDGICADVNGNCTLRAAITQANATPGADTIAFNVPGSGPYTIAPNPSPLPTVSDTLTIDGTTQPGFASLPIVEIRGDSAGSNADGLHFSGLNNLVKGLVINRFSANGVSFQGGGGSRVEGSFIGTDAGGTVDLGNGNDGVLITDSPNNMIGGSVPGVGNLIAGNGQLGVQITGNTATGNSVRGNLIGTDRSGNLAMPNSAGVSVSSSNRGVGGAAILERNVISGNGGFRLAIFSATGNVVRGNFIGTNAAGTAALGNSVGMYINGAPGNTIGGLGAGEGNVISGNTGYGVDFFVVSSGNMIQGNRIGTDVTGTKNLGNGGNGIQCSIVGTSPGNIIGGTDPGAGNVISGNDGSGISLTGIDCLGCRIQGNFMGTDITGTQPVGNSGAGITSYLDDTVIGGTASGEANRIGYNGGIGVNVGGARSPVRANSIFSNAGLGIDRGGDGVTPNDSGDSDGIQNYPEIISAISPGGNTTVTGRLDSAPAATFQLDFFVTDQCDPSLYGEGERFLGTTTVVTDSRGVASFTVTFPGVDLDADLDGRREAVTATATDGAGNSSEFSRCSSTGDNCPEWYNPAQNLPPWPVPPNDPDCDGFSTRVENSAGTDPSVQCGPDAWPADINNDTFVDVIGDISRVTAEFGKSVPPAPARYDIGPDPPDNFIDVIGDITRLTGLFGQHCV